MGSRLPGLVTRDGERKVRVMRGLELTLRQTALALVGLLVLFALPDIARLSPSIQLSVLHQGIVFGLAAVGLNLLVRHTQLVSFGHAAFFGTGAYTTAVLAAKYDVTEFALLLLASMLLATLMAMLIGFLSLRHTGLYFSLLTLAFGQLLYALVQGQSFFGSSDGLPVRPGPNMRPDVFGLGLPPDAYSVLLFYLTVILSVLGLLVMWRIIHSPFGAALDAIGQDRTRAKFIGIPVRRYVWLAFVISAVYGGMAGALYAMVQQHVRPGPVLYFLRSGDILFMAILGGYQTLLGPLVGGIVLVLLQDVGRDLTNYFDALTGLVLLALVFGFPQGIVGSLKQGGRVREAAASFKDDPAVVGSWLSSFAESLVTAASRSVQNVKVLVFGVK
ncbi:branched-chain amino acid ABC transporter permease [Haladaptatus sp. GCM10025707]|uniref:branched-chain amino acid ABC transporter permease n=1 Tax=unclassified Haladaptatus TaxID=2622732 RepID=UPI0023E874F8|nr:MULTISPECIES: branched-chain amino acid ABC transporter permease [unclassified Haladaptatus]